jgi:hypothetical protein
MLKQKSILEVKIDDRLYEFQCDGAAPLGEIHDVLCRMKQYIVQRIVDAEKAEVVKEPEVTVE